MTAPIAQDREHEHARLGALRRYAILDTGREEEFDQLVVRMARECGYPAALITLMDEHRCWFKATTGLHAAERGLTELPRELTFCNHAFCSSGIFVVRDAREDARFAELPFVKREDGYRAYVGAQLITPDGFSIGTVCVLDDEPREPTREQLDALRAAAVRTMALLEARQRDIGPAPPVAVAAPRRAVLVVDDETLVRQFVAHVLRKRAVEVLEAVDGAEALQKFREHADRIGAVLTDVHMPNLDGYGLIEALQHESRPPALAVMSGRLDRAMETRLRALRVECVLAKPFKVSDIERVVALLPA